MKTLIIYQGWYCHCPPNFVSSHATCQSPLINESLLFKANPVAPVLPALIDGSLLFKDAPDPILSVYLY